MSGEAAGPGDASVELPIDWMDLKFAVVVGIIATVLKVTRMANPEWFHSFNDGLVPSLLCIGYIIARARRQPEKLDEWGLTTPLTAPAVLMGFVLLGIAVGLNAVSGLALTGRLGFEPWYVPDMVDYILGAFPQQFFMCSVGLVTLAKIPAFKGTWRLPLTVGLVFSLAHWWTPAHIPGTFIPVQMVTTLPAGFILTLYFLKFRNILPLTIIHAITFVVGVNWVETHL
jgi:membrane protease YdiL (CAAX protease family)